MLMDTMTAPSTPRKSEAEKEAYKHIIRGTIDNLSWQWGLKLPVHPEGESPAKRPRTIENEIVSKITFLCYRDSIDSSVQEFETKAQSMYTGWVLKPKAERGASGVPEKTRQCPRPVSDEERTILLDSLLKTLNPTFDSMKSPRKHQIGQMGPNASMGTQGPQNFDDSPVPLVFKRSRETLQEEKPSFKKPKLPDQRDASSSRTPSLPAPCGGSRSAKSSFTSNASSVFSNVHLNRSDTSFPTVFTQDTVLSQDPVSGKTEVGFDAQSYRDPVNISFQSNTQSSEYDGASSFDADLVAELDSKLIGVGMSDPAIDEELSQDLVGQAAIVEEGTPALYVDEIDLREDELQDRLRTVFPALPPSLRDLPLRVSHEIVRVFEKAGVSFTNVDFSMLSNSDNYENLWKFFTNHRLLKGKSLPERCCQQAWDGATGDFLHGSRSVFMSGSLQYNDSQSFDPLFRFQLNPLSLDSSHRLGRRFGQDRFLEIDVPDLTGKHAPKLVTQLGVRGRELIIKWLVEESHNFLGRTWKPFFVKPKDRAKRKAVTTQKSIEDTDPVFRVTFFAIDGANFIQAPIPLDCSLQPPVKIPVKALLNHIRPTRKNISQSFSKLFSRTALALSRNTPTVILEREQIKYKDDIRCEGEVMTDGGGRISPTLALKVAQILQLSYFPSAFQGRLGEAKGLWSVHYHDESCEDWIEVYESQRKWTRSTKKDGESDDVSHRTFEVLTCSAPLKSAALNLQFLPLLIDRAIDRDSMRDTISRIMQEGLHREISSLSTSMESPQSFRKWIRDTRPNMKERSTLGAIAYQGGLPSNPDERMNALLDAGFDAKKLLFMKEMARTMFKSKCDELKEKLNITVANSTNAFMIPDFEGVLEPDEVYIDLSDFKDKATGLPGPLMNGREILVARSPAHFASDIQKVKAVLKVECMGLKNCIVFPTKVRKGTPSLAAKLSGGDYDGDMAWVCWEKSLVENFVNADVPECPNLVEEGFIRKDSATYGEVVQNHANPTSIFLRRSFEFNMVPSLLGKCTVWKEEVCYAQRRVDTEEAICLSTLLGLLVDQAKQGFVFTEDDRQRLQQKKIKVTTCKVLYKGKDATLDPRAKHIVDRLKYVANETVEKALTEFQKRFPEAQKWDDDLAAFYGWAKTKAKTESNWAMVLEDLVSDIEALKAEWAKEFNTRDESKPDFLPLKVAYCDKFQAIRPHQRTQDTAFIQALSPDCFPDPDISSWSLLKASALFASYTSKRKSMSNAVWYFAGKQLCFLKAIWGGNMTAVAPWMYAILGPVSGLVKALENREPPAKCAEISSDPDDVEDDE